VRVACGVLSRMDGLGGGEPNRGRDGKEKAIADLSDVLADVNARISELAAEQAVGPDGESWEFMCECGKQGCHERVPMSLSDYEALRQTGAAVLAPGHHPPSRTQRARTRVRTLVEEAKALSGQARQQAQRAREKSHQ
jgi:hypothetical protein